MYLFIIISIIVTLLATTMIFLKTPINSTLSLCAILLLSTCLLFLSHVEFIAYIFIMVYVGGIALLFLFVIIMLNLKIDYDKDKNSFSLLSGSTFLFIIALKMQSSVVLNMHSIHCPYKMQQLLKIHYVFSNDILGFGLLLYTHYFFNFLLAGIILLISMLGVLVLSLNSKKSD